MAGVVRNAKIVLSPTLLQCCRIGQRQISSTPTICAAWNKDWKPGPPPTTAEERAAAAKKYGMRVEDYEPYDPETESGYGDYPKLKGFHHPSMIDPSEHLDFPAFGRNYMEPVHAMTEQHTADRPIPDVKGVAPHTQGYMLGQFLSVFLGLAFLDWLCQHYDIMTHFPAFPKQYPNNLWLERGLEQDKMPPCVHYTFEKAE